MNISNATSSGPWTGNDTLNDLFKLAFSTCSGVPCLSVNSAGGSSSVAIGSTVTGGTAGSVLYLGVAGILAQDNANFFFNATSHGLRIGPRPPALVDGSFPSSLEVIADSAGGDNSVIDLVAFGDSMSLRLSATNGTLAAPTVGTNGQDLGDFVWQGYDGAALQRSVKLRGLIGGTVASGIVPGQLSAFTTASDGAEYERLRLTAVGTTAMASPQATSTITLTGQTELQIGPLLWKGSTSGILTQAWPATITSHTLTWPSAQGAASTVLQNNGSGVLSWATVPAAVQTRRVCSLVVGAENGVALVDADLGPQGQQCKVAAAATVQEIVVNSDAGTPNTIVRKKHCATFAAGVCTSWTSTDLLSSALAAAASNFDACSNTGGTTGLDGGTTCSATLQNGTLAVGDWIELKSGTAGGTAKRLSVDIIYTIN